MEQLLIELLKSSPIGAGIITIVWIFLQHLDKRDKAFRQSLKEQHDEFRQSLKEQHDAFRQDLTDRDRFIENLGGQCHAVQKEAVQVMRESIIQNARHAEVVKQLLERETK